MDKKKNILPILPTFLSAGFNHFLLTATTLIQALSLYAHKSFFDHIILFLWENTYEKNSWVI